MLLKGNMQNKNVHEKGLYLLARLGFTGAQMVEDGPADSRQRLAAESRALISKLLLLSLLL